MKKTTKSDMAARYKEAEQIVWNSLENWQRVAITEDRKSHRSSSVFETFTAQVIALAENKSQLAKAKQISKTTDKKSVDTVSRIK